MMVASASLNLILHDTQDENIFPLGQKLHSQSRKNRSWVPMSLKIYSILPELEFTLQGPPQ